MKRMKRALTLLLAVMLACVLMAGYAMAAEEEAVWLVAEETAGVVSGKVETNAAVTNGVIRVTFDPAKLTYTGCDFAGEYEAYVAMNAVNDTKAADCLGRPGERFPGGCHCGTVPGELYQGTGQ